MRERIGSDGKRKRRKEKYARRKGREERVGYEIICRQERRNEGRENRKGKIEEKRKRKKVKSREWKENNRKEGKGGKQIRDKKME